MPSPTVAGAATETVVPTSAAIFWSFTQAVREGVQSGFSINKTLGGVFSSTSTAIGIWLSGGVPIMAKSKEVDGN